MDQARVDGSIDIVVIAHKMTNRSCIVDHRKPVRVKNFSAIKNDETTT